MAIFNSTEYPSEYTEFNYSGNSSDDSNSELIIGITFGWEFSLGLPDFPVSGTGGPGFQFVLGNKGFD